MNSRDIARVVQRTMKLAGVEGDFAGHSLRVGHRPSVDGRASRLRAAGDAPLRMRRLRRLWQTPPACRWGLLCRGPAERVWLK